MTSAASAAPLLELSGIAKSFGAVRALKGVSFTLGAGEVHALLGENGAGKSTLIKVVAGAHAPDSGEMRVDGVRVERFSPAQAHRLGIACIYQQPALFPDLTVAENLALALEPPTPWRLIRNSVRQERAVQLLREIGAGEIDPAREVRALSMPEQQLVEIAKAIGTGARILIMDEPTASLTRQEVTALLRLVRELRARGTGIVYISHRLEEIGQVADRVTVLRDGESVGTLPAAEAPERELIRLMVGREMASIYPPAQGAPGAVALSAQGLSCQEAGLADVSFEVRAGEIFGLAGLVGAGRTELARTLFGLTPADAGQITLEGRTVRIGSVREAIAEGLAYLPEDRRQHGAVLPFSIAGNISLASLDRLFPGGWLRPQCEDAVAQEQMRALRVKAPSPAVAVGTLSGGNQQKVALARWLVTKPKVLLLDEPTQGVDIGAKAEIHGIIRELAAAGLAVVLISSDLPEVLGMSDRIGVMRGGRLVATLPGSEATAEGLMALALGQYESEPDATAKVEASGRQSEIPRGLGSWREGWVVGALGLLLAILALWAPAFFAPQQLLTMLTAAAPVLLVSAGVGLVIVTRQIDISLGTQFAWCSVLAGLAAAAGWPMPAVAAVAMGTGALFGALNGVLVCGLGLPSIVVTLATMVTGRETLRWWREGVFISDLPASFQWFGLSQGGGQAAILAIVIGLFVLLALATRFLSGARFVYAAGSDADAARLAGLRPRTTAFGVFVLMGGLVGLAALLNAVRFSDIDPKTGQGLEMQAIAAAVVGGIAISGGRGTLWGVLAGVVLLACIGPALVFLQIQPQWERAIQGTIILLAVAAEGMTKRRRTHF